MAGAIVALRWVWDRGEAARVEAYALTLKADDPSTLNPFGDLVDVDRLDCETASGKCVRRSL
jgi:hypothetical protein